MRRVVAILFLTLLGCAVTPPPQVPSAPAVLEVGTDGILNLVGRHGRLAHACPIGPDLAVTAAHVLDIRPFDRNQPLAPFRFSTPLGDEGLLLPLYVLSASDLGLAKLVPPVRVFYPVAAEAPEVGEKVRFVQFRSVPDHYLERESKEARVLRVVAGHAELSEEPKLGSSGSCVLNESGEIVGVLSYGAPGSAFGTGVWGLWRGALKERKAKS